MSAALLQELESEQQETPFRELEKQYLLIQSLLTLNRPDRCVLSLIRSHTEMAMKKEFMLLDLETIPARIYRNASDNGHDSFQMPHYLDLKKSFYDLVEKGFVIWRVNFISNQGFLISRSWQCFRKKNSSEDEEQLDSLILLAPDYAEFFEKIKNLWFVKNLQFLTDKEFYEKVNLLLKFLEVNRTLDMRRSVQNATSYAK